MIKEGKKIETDKIMFLPETMTRQSFVAFIDKGDWKSIKKNLKELMDSMKAIGLVQPIGVREAGKNHYLLIFGLRRLIAAKLLGWKKILSVVHK